MFYYLGRKHRLAALYPDPAHDTIIEPFAGSAAYSLHGDRWQRDVVLLEIDPAIAALWRYLLAASPADIRGLPVPRVGESLEDYAGLTEPERWLIRQHINPGSSQRSQTVTSFSRWTGSKRDKIADELRKIRHWTVVEGDYTSAPDLQATWFIDPPYHRSGRFYRFGSVNYSELGEWALSRQGQVIACEQAGATWLPFEPLRRVAGPVEERTTRGTGCAEQMFYDDDGCSACSLVRPVLGSTR